MVRPARPFGEGPTAGLDPKTELLPRRHNVWGIGAILSGGPAQSANVSLGQILAEIVQVDLYSRRAAEPCGLPKGSDRQDEGLPFSQNDLQAAGQLGGHFIRVVG